jgi:hypothetical protein
MKEPNDRQKIQQNYIENGESTITAKITSGKKR